MLEIGARIEGMEPLTRKLNYLPAAIHKKILRQAFAPAARLVTREVRQAIRAQAYETGTLEKSIGQKSKAYGERAIVFLVGPRTKWGAFVTPPGRTKPQKRTPWRYAHLTESGSKARTIKTGRGRGHSTGNVMAKHWMTNTWNRLKPRVTVMIISKVQEGIAREWLF
jgi:hypothetical protein